MNFEIFGATGTIDDPEKIISKLKELNNEYRIFVQLFNAKLVYGREHLHSAVIHAERAFTNNTNLADDPSVEIILYASGERQIKQAIEKMGIKKGLEQFAVVIYHPEGISPELQISELIHTILNTLELSRDDSVLDGDAEVLKSFGITETELNAVLESSQGNLILSRVAMVEVIK